MADKLANLANQLNSVLGPLPRRLQALATVLRDKPDPVVYSFSSLMGHVRDLHSSIARLSDYAYGVLPGALVPVRPDVAATIEVARKTVDQLSTVILNSSGTFKQPPPTTPKTPQKKDLYPGPPGFGSKWDFLEMHRRDLAEKAKEERKAEAGKGHAPSGPVPSELSKEELLAVARGAYVSYTPSGKPVPSPGKTPAQQIVEDIGDILQKQMEAINRLLKDSTVEALHLQGQWKTPKEQKEELLRLYGLTQSQYDELTKSRPPEQLPVTLADLEGDKRDPSTILRGLTLRDEKELKLFVEKEKKVWQDAKESGQKLLAQIQHHEKTFERDKEWVGRSPQEINDYRAKLLKEIILLEKKLALTEERKKEIEEWQANLPKLKKEWEDRARAELLAYRTEEVQALAVQYGMSTEQVERAYPFDLEKALQERTAEDEWLHKQIFPKAKRGLRAYYRQYPKDIRKPKIDEVPAKMMAIVRQAVRDRKQQERLGVTPKDGLTEREFALNLIEKLRREDPETVALYKESKEIIAEFAAEEKEYQEVIVAMNSGKLSPELMKMIRDAMEGGEDEPPPAAPPSGSGGPPKRPPPPAPPSSPPPDDGGEDDATKWSKQGGILGEQHPDITHEQFESGRKKRTPQPQREGGLVRITPEGVHEQFITDATASPTNVLKRWTETLNQAQNLLPSLKNWDTQGETPEDKKVYHDLIEELAEKITDVLEGKGPDNTPLQGSELGQTISRIQDIFKDLNENWTDALGKATTAISTLSQRLADAGKDAWKLLGPSPYGLENPWAPGHTVAELNDRRNLPYGQRQSENPDPTKHDFPPGTPHLGQTPHWQAMRGYVLEQAKGTCETCGKIGEKLYLGHLNRKHMGHEHAEDLAAQCAACNKATDEVNNPQTRSELKARGKLFGPEGSEINKLVEDEVAKAKGLLEAHIDSKIPPAPPPPVNKPSLPVSRVEDLSREDFEAGLLKHYASNDPAEIAKIAAGEAQRTGIDPDLLKAFGAVINAAKKNLDEAGTNVPLTGDTGKPATGLTEDRQKDTDELNRQILDLLTVVLQPPKLNSSTPLGKLSESLNALNYSQNPLVPGYEQGQVPDKASGYVGGAGWPHFGPPGGGKGGGGGGFGGSLPPPPDPEFGKGDLYDYLLAKDVTTGKELLNKHQVSDAMGQAIGDFGFGDSKKAAKAMKVMRAVEGDPRAIAQLIQEQVQDMINKAKATAAHTMGAWTSESFGAVGGHIFGAAEKGVQTMVPGEIGEMLSAPLTFSRYLLNAVDALRSFNAQLLQSDFRFAEYSGPMARVKALTEVGDIMLSQQRGNRRAGHAEVLAESLGRLERAVAPWEDKWAAIKDTVMAGVADYATEGIDLLTDIAEKVGIIVRDGEGENELGDMLDTTSTMGDRDWARSYGRPTRFNTSGMEIRD